MKYLFLSALFICISHCTLLAQVQPSLKVEGEVLQPLQLNAGDLAKMKRVTVSANDRDGKAHSYSGAAVSDILNRAGVSAGKELRGENLAKYLLVKCADGYQVLFSLAELDTSFNNKLAILADESDGKPLPEGKGPFRLVVEGEKKPARNCFQVTAFVIGFSKE